MGLNDVWINNYVATNISYRATRRWKGSDVFRRHRRQTSRWTMTIAYARSHTRRSRALITTDIQGKTYSYNNDGSIKAATNNLDSAYSQTYEYDFASRLKKKNNVSGTSGPYRQMESSGSGRKTVHRSFPTRRSSNEVPLPRMKKLP